MSARVTALIISVVIGLLFGLVMWAVIKWFGMDDDDRNT